MIDRRRVTSRVGVATFAVAGLTTVGALLAAPAWADPAAPILPDPAAPGQPVVVPDAPVAAPAPAPMTAPMVPEIENQVYGSGQYGGGALGTLRDLWHQSRDPYAMVSPADPDAVAPGPPPGAGAPPPLPPGYKSLNAPGSETASTAGPVSGGPALPPGYYPLTGPPPPGYEYNSMNEPPPPPPPAPPVTIMAPSYRN